MDPDGRPDALVPVDGEERRRAVQERVRLVDVVGADGELVAVEPVADREAPLAGRLDLPRVLAHLPRAGALQGLHVARVLADQVRARRPDRHEQREGLRERVVRAHRRLDRQEVGASVRDRNVVMEREGHGPSGYPISSEL